MRRPAVLLLLLLGALAAGSCAEKARHKVIVLGIDGMDPRIAADLMAQGHLPNLKRMADAGGYRELGTSIPPESPVAWSNFITGQNPGGHGIFDFLHKKWVVDQATGEASFVPVDAVAEVTADDWVMHLFGYRLPLKPGEPINKRRGRAFWEVLEDHDVPATVFRIPADFPPTATGQRTLSGMGTPDVQGGYGTYYLYTDDKFAVSDKVESGKVITVSIYDNVVRDFLYGPDNTLVDVAPGRPAPATRVPLRVDLDPLEPLARILIGDEDDGEQLVLREGEWSEFVEADFDIIPYVTGVTGMVRFMLQEVRPNFRLFVDPINVSPRAPAFDISTPPEWVTELADEHGLFVTKGMPENTKALEEGVLTQDEMREHSRLIYENRKQLLFGLLDDHASGLLFHYFGSVDLNSHMFWACKDDRHPGHDAAGSQESRDFIEFLYRDLDRVVGDVQQRLAPEDTLIVMSDHGFAPYYRSFNLNTWLLDNGYLALKEGADRDNDPGYLQSVDWSKTRAYNLGFACIYLNVRGRDPLGIVTPEEAAALTDEICARLVKETDPQNGKAVFLKMYKTREVYSGAAVADAPEIVVGFRREYRNSNESTIGKFPRELLVDNLDKWSGCHLMAAEEVPGVVFANRVIRHEDPKLYDLTATILAEYGIATPAEMIGRPLWPANPDLAR